MLVVCNNKNKDWCPHKKKDCECDAYYPHELKNGENRHISCTDINYDWQDCYLEEIKRETKMTNEEILSELREGYEKCNELFNVAYELNNNGNTRTIFTQKVTTYMSDILQMTNYLIGEFEEGQKK